MDNRPIGVFDSGLGGLTVVKQLKKILPDESIVYFGDTGRVPYGTRSRDTIIKYACEDIDFLLKHDVKMIIAACGTVSAVLPKNITDNFDFPYSGVLIPACRAAVRQTKTKKIGVIGTSATIRSGKYAEEISKLLPDASVVSAPCPLFVPLVENGFIERQNKVTRLVAEQYLAPIINNGCDVLILGCTHFPIIKPIIADIVGKDVKLIDPGEQTAFLAKAVLDNCGMRSEGSVCTSFYVSDEIDSFEKVASVFLNTDIKSSHVKKVEL